MAGTLAHRGPDDSGAWVEANAGVALGHTRLSIIDLSTAGHQPMESHDGRVVLVFNGEIYNFGELRRELKAVGCVFRGASDSETLVNGFAEWGIRQTVERTNGMFAFAAWDRRKGTLTLGRDRLGIKPLYYGRFGGTFLFGSELKALRTHYAFDARVCRKALSEFVQHGFVPAPLSIYEGVSKLPPGCLLEVPAPLDGQISKPEPFWSMQRIVDQRPQRAFGGSYEDGVRVLRKQLSESVKSRLVSDVPLGAFLSGGIDSSLVVALMRSVSEQPVDTFTIGFHEAEYDEAGYARDIAKHLGTQHHEHYVTPDEAQQAVAKIPWIFDEPFADPSQIPTYLVSKFARQHVTVVLSGDGGDELFGGYARYRHIDSIRQKAARVPWFARRLLAAVIRQPVVRGLVGKSKRSSGLWNDVLGARTTVDLYRSLHRHWRRPFEVVQADELSGGGLDLDVATLKSTIEQMMAIDTVTYLPDDILTKVDRASMAVGLEARVPLLDHQVVETAWNFPAEFRFQPHRTKRMLRDVLEEFLPAQMFERPKTGFGLPIDQWLRGPMRDWGEDLLNETRLRNEGFFHSDEVREKWNQHQQGTHDWHYLLWDILMFQVWLEAQDGSVS